MYLASSGVCEIVVRLPVDILGHVGIKFDLKVLKGIETEDVRGQSKELSVWT